DGFVLALRLATEAAAKTKDWFSSTDESRARIERLNVLIGEQMKRMKERGESLQNDKKLEEEVDKAVAGLAETLTRVHTAMANAGKSTNEHAQSQEHLGTAAKGTTQQLETQNDVTDEMIRHQREAATAEKRFKEAMEELRSAGDGWKGT